MKLAKLCWLGHILMENNRGPGLPASLITPVPWIPARKAAARKSSKI